MSDSNRERLREERSSPTGVRLATEVTFGRGRASVRVDLWLVSVAIALGIAAHRGVSGAAVWTGIFLGTVLLREVARASVAGPLRWPVELRVTFFRPPLDRSPGVSPARRMAACLIGPCANLIAGAVALGWWRSYHGDSELVRGALHYAAVVNAAWGFVHLLPILPLDGGHALATLLDAVTHGRGDPAVRYVSLAATLVLGFGALTLKWVVPAFFCLALSIRNAQNLRWERLERLKKREADLRVGLLAAFCSAEGGDTAAAIAPCAAVLRQSYDLVARQDALRLLAYAYATTGDWAALMRILESGGAAIVGEDALERYQAAAKELGRATEATRIALLRDPVA